MFVLLLYIIGARHRTSAPWNEHKTIVLKFYVASTKVLWTMNGKRERGRGGGTGFVGKGSNLGCRRNWRPSRSMAESVLQSARNSLRICTADLKNSQDLCKLGLETRIPVGRYTPRTQVSIGEFSG